MLIFSAEIPDIKILQAQKHEDARGFFSETFNEKCFRGMGIALRFVQDNQSLSTEKGTIRGLHFQSPPFAQAKLVRVLRGRIWDVVVDLRKSSPTFGKWLGVEIAAESLTQIFVPIGFAHGFCTLEDNCEVLYKVSHFYSKEHEVGICWDDPSLSIPWPLEGSSPIVSTKDEALGRFEDLKSPF